MLSTKVRILPGRTAAHAWGTTLFGSAMVEGGHPCLGSRPTFDPKHAQLGPCLDSELASPWHQHPVGPKRLPCHMLYGAGHCLGRTQSYIQTPHRPWQHLIPQDLDVPKPVHGSIHHEQITPPPMVDCTPYHDWWPRFPLLGWTQASISLSPCLQCTWTGPSLWYRENRDSSMKIRCLHCLRSHTLCLLLHSRRRRLCSKMSLGHLAGWRDQYPVARSHFRMVRNDIHLPNWRIICICRRGAEMKRLVLWPFRAVDGLPWCGDFHRTSTLPLMWSASLSVASQNFAYASLRHPQHPGYFSLRIAICRQPDNLLQYLLWQILWHDPL